MNLQKEVHGFEVSLRLNFIFDFKIIETTDILLTIMNMTTSVYYRQSKQFRCDEKDRYFKLIKHLTHYHCRLV